MNISETITATIGGIFGIFVLVAMACIAGVFVLAMCEKEDENE